MAAFKDMTGLKFGKWKVLKLAEKRGQSFFWKCRCECGTTKRVSGVNLRRGLSKSCGCDGKSWCRIHGKCTSPEYYAWAAMIQRCCNPKNKFYDLYGGRGISVCERWRGSFDAFDKDMGKRPEGRMSIGRIDPNGNYEPSNCRWENWTQQSRNKITTKYLVYQGQSKPMSEWAEIMGIKRKVLENRIRQGWDVERALTTPRSGRWGIIK